jgi:hypothetical protein
MARPRSSPGRIGSGGFRRPCAAARKKQRNAARGAAVVPMPIVAIVLPSTASIL